MTVTTSQPMLKSRRLTLRAPRAADVRRLACLANDREVTRMTGSMPYPFAVSDAEAFVARAAACDPAREATFALENETGLIGVMGFHPKGGLAPEIGYWLGRAFWGRGYATEAARTALAWLKGEWRKRVVIAGHYADNPASGAVLCKAGFLYTGEVQQRPCRTRGEDVPTRMMVWLA